MLESLKKDVVHIAHRAQREGLCKHRSGSFSARDATTGMIAVTPAGIEQDEMGPRDVVVMDLDARVVESPWGLRPAAEVLMHLAIYEARPDVRAIAHTRSAYATAFSVLGRPLPAVVFEAAALGLTKARVPVAPYERPGTPALANAVLPAVLEADVLLLARHGVVAVDHGSIDEAFLKAAYVEELAELYHHALLANGGREPESFDQDELSRWEYPREVSFPGE
ncbi:class II aldolase/adducin family protein [Xylanimonas allomyrinae]|uniref:Class II aldolase/adducin family protein n=1 Tax=Xylanimonas allomyrinae TaxID=2509459 RepID=A0A4V0YEJ1_9MICO|nr:class II aldolase/adducin family protein [Xylanimonas allomyrinae]QAY64391.1 class II aldolase/adducin family protein [Xylanimonas allomyrinae]